MTILLQDIKLDSNWNGKSVNPVTQKKEPNLESCMSFEEHQRIVYEALRTLLAVDMNLSNDLKFKPPWKWLDELQEAHNSVSPYTLWITKGIHQPTTSPHIQLKLYYDDPLEETTKSTTKGNTYHLNVGRSAARIDRVGHSLPEPYFHWVGVQLTAAYNNITVCWPEQPTVLTDTTGQRRNSIAPEAVRGMIQKLRAQQQTNT
jgi:hypothetical protein